MKEITKENSLPDRESIIYVSDFHHVNKKSIKNFTFDDYSEIFLGLGCFWGAEKLFWNLSDIYVTSVGYCGGFTKNPTYQDICSGYTGHAEVVRIIFQKNILILKKILKVFWENHDPTQGMKQGNDIGEQYRSCVYVNDIEFFNIANQSKDIYQKNLYKNNIKNVITTEIELNKLFYYAEDYHQQYLSKNPSGYCGICGLGVEFKT